MEGWTSFNTIFKPVIRYAHVLEEERWAYGSFEEAGQNDFWGTSDFFKNQNKIKPDTFIAGGWSEEADTVHKEAIDTRGDNFIHCTATVCSKTPMIVCHVWFGWSSQKKIFTTFRFWQETTPKEKTAEKEAEEKKEDKKMRTEDEQGSEGEDSVLVIEEEEEEEEFEDDALVTEDLDNETKADQPNGIEEAAPSVIAKDSKTDSDLKAQCCMPLDNDDDGSVPPALIKKLVDHIVLESKKKRTLEEETMLEEKRRMEAQVSEEKEQNEAKTAAEKAEQDRLQKKIAEEVAKEKLKQLELQFQANEKKEKAAKEAEHMRKLEEQKKEKDRSAKVKEAKIKAATQPKEVPEQKMISETAAEPVEEIQKALQNQFDAAMGVAKQAENAGKKNVSQSSTGAEAKLSQMSYQEAMADDLRLEEVAAREAIAALKAQKHGKTEDKQDDLPLKAEDFYADSGEDDGPGKTAYQDLC